MHPLVCLEESGAKKKMYIFALSDRPPFELSNILVVLLDLF